MYIKQIIIQGFKSYKDQTVIEPFSPKHNVIVGRNGSGKSNFFAAIRFVLSDAYTQMGREERGALLHEGAGSAVMSAYVEIIFDNSDERFPMDTKDVVLRRTVGQKKDEYSINRKNTTKNEVNNLLESAGFSRSNPYYIVPQGRVTLITNMTDAARLNLLKEVAGTNVYDEKRKSSVKEIADTEARRAKIDDLLEQIRGRLGELEEEKEELRAFQDKDKERRCLEYVVHRKEQEAAQMHLDEYNKTRDNGVEQTDENREALRQEEAQLEAIEHEIGELQQQLSVLSEEKAQLEEERKDSVKEKAKLELDVQSMVDGQAAAQQARTQHEQDLKDVQNQVKQREAELERLLPEYTAKREQEKTLRDQMQAADLTIQGLYGKQGRQGKFKSKRDRDQWLRSEIDDMNVSVAQRKAVLMETTEEITELESQIGQLDAEIVDMRDRIENRGDQQQNLSGEVQRAREEQHRLQDQRKELWREEAKLDSALDTAKNELEKAEQFLHKMMDQNTSRGLKNVRRLVQQHEIEGVHGALGDLFTYSDKYKTAIEVTAGTSLFNIVVDNEAISARLTELLRKDQLGRITFVPLDNIRIRPADIPKADDCVHLPTKLKYNEKYAKAIEQVFGKTIVCPHLQVAAQYARSNGVTAVTPDGDRSDKKGALTGGWVDTRNSRLEGMKREKKAREDYESKNDRKREISDELKAIDQQVTKTMSEVQKIEQRRVQLEGGYGNLREEIRRQQEQLNLRQDELERKQKQKDTLESLVRDMGRQISGFETELAGDFKKALSNEEERQLETLSAQLPDMRKNLGEVKDEMLELEGRKSTLELELRENLRLRLDQLLASAGDADAGASRDGGSSSTRLKERQRDLKRVSKALESITAKLNENESSIEQVRQALQSTETERNEKQTAVEKLRTAIHNHRRAVDKAATKRAVVTAQLTTVATAIRNLGVLPEAAFSRQYADMNATTALKRLHKVQDSLKQYSHVNKKAFEQFAQHEREAEVLEKRREELSGSDSSIRELIDVLDTRKDEAIERTFRQVSREFARIFERLVPAGRGRLVIQRRSDKQAARTATAEADSEDEEEQAAARPGGGGVEAYTGVAIHVSFNSKADEQQKIQQLSGGQKSLCALALVFAIQASDPAPFYLFDEIDANLDAQYRTAVAQLLRESSETGQFICTTFRPEMLLVAAKCYGVGYVNKASSIDVVNKEDALSFVEGEVGGGARR